MSPILEVCAIFILSCATPTLTRPSAYVQEQHGSLIAISWNLSVYFTGNETNTIIASATVSNVKWRVKKKKLGKPTFFGKPIFKSLLDAFSISFFNTE